jgi:hypothetical protein
MTFLERVSKTKFRQLQLLFAISTVLKFGVTPQRTKKLPKQLEILPANSGNIVAYAIVEAKAWSCTSISTNAHIFSE